MVATDRQPVRLHLASKRVMERYIPIGDVIGVNLDRIGNVSNSTS